MRAEIENRVIALRDEMCISESRWRNSAAIETNERRKEDSVLRADMYFAFTTMLTTIIDSEKQNAPDVDTRRFNPECKEPCNRACIDPDYWGCKCKDESGGWIKKQLDAVAKEAEGWPEWRKAESNTRFRKEGSE